MKISELIKYLQSLDQDLDVYIEALNVKDADGAQTPVKVIETYFDFNRVVLRDDF